MMFRNFLLSLVFFIALPAMAQDSLQFRITVSDTIRLNPRFDMLVEFPKPLIYDVWFKRIMACEGLTMPPDKELNRLRFFVVNSESFFLDFSYRIDAAMLNQKHVMIITLPSIYDYDVIAHEFLHFVLWYTFGPIYIRPENAHPQQYFGRCNIRPF